ncbi:MAG: hypothetical protein LCH32_00890 [Bacteroidetes bacterium]|nr:hypothetical protein [Bacteroidota bacterium]
MTAVRKIRTATAPYLRVIKGGKFSPKNNIVENTWIFIHAALWCNNEFTNKEETQFQNLIAEHYNTVKNPTKVFEEIIERVCLAKRYVNRKRGRYLSKPIDWLNINYHKGLAGTEGWYQEVCLQRISVPEYNKGITLLAKSITKYLQEPTIKTIVAVRKKLIAQKQFDLLQMFNNAVINFQINN